MWSDPPYILQDVSGSIILYVKALNDSDDISYNDPLILLVSKKGILNLFRWDGHGDLKMHGVRCTVHLKSADERAVV